MNKRKIAGVVAMTLLLQNVNIYAEEEITTYFGMQNGAAVAQAANFYDVGSMGDYWAKPAIYQMGALEIIKGMGDGNFAPRQQVTTEQAIALVLNAMGKESEVKDIEIWEKTGNWSDTYIKFAMKDGLISEKVVIKKSEAKTDIKALKKSGVLIRDLPITREEVAVLIAKALGLGQSNKNEMAFADADLISKDNRGYVEAVYEKGIMIGDENRNFEPQSYLKREEMAQILLNIETNILEKNRLAKREGVIEAIDANEISLSDENGDIIIIDIRGKDFPVYKDGMIGGKMFLALGDEIEYIFDVSKKIRYIEVVGNDPTVKPIEDDDTANAAVQGMVTDVSRGYIQISTKNYETREYFYDEYFTDFHKDNRSVSADEIIVGDTVQINLDENGDVIEIWATGNYKTLYGYVNRILGGNINIKYSDGTENMFSTRDIEILKNNKLVNIDDVIIGEYAKLQVYETNTGLRLKKVEIIPDERTLANIYKGKISSIDFMENRIVLKNPEKYEEGIWYRDSNGFVSIVLDEDAEIFRENKAIERADLDGWELDKNIYIATRKDASSLEKGKLLRIEESDNEVTYQGTVTNYKAGNGQIRLENTDDVLTINNGVILIKDGKILTAGSLSEDDNVYITAQAGSYANNVSVAVVYHKDEEPVEIYRGEIEDIVDNKSVTFKEYSILKGMTWETINKPKTIEMDYETRIIGDSGVFPIRDFSLLKDKTYKGKAIYIVVKDNKAVLISTGSFGSYNMTGNIKSIDDSSIVLYNASQFDMNTEKWTEANEDVTLNILESTIIIKNNSVVEAEDIGRNQKIRVIKGKDSLDAYMILVG